MKFQQRVWLWMFECFGGQVARDTVERNHRFLEESLELVQSTGTTQAEAHALVDYVYGRPIGEPVQELGGVMVTLAALAEANDLNMEAAGDVEVARISEASMMEKIRAKQATKPKHSPLPGQSGLQRRDGEFFHRDQQRRELRRESLDDWDKGQNMAVQNQRAPLTGTTSTVGGFEAANDLVDDPAHFLETFERLDP